MQATVVTRPLLREVVPGSRTLWVLLFAIASVGVAVSLNWISDRDFWWDMPRGGILLFLFAYGLGLMASAVAGLCGLVLLFRTTGLRRAAGLMVFLAMAWVLSGITSTVVLAYVAIQADILAGNIESATVRYEREAQMIRLSGPLETGSAARFKEVLATAPDVRIVDVSGPGGMIYEARYIAGMIEERELDTMISTECYSACVSIFASGKRRVMNAKAIVGLHSASTFTGRVADDANRAFAERLYRIGVEPRFLMVGADTSPDDMWINTARQAYLAGLATAVVGP